MVIRQRLYDKVNEEVRSFARRYGLDDVNVDERNGIKSLESAAKVLRDSYPDAELFILVDEFDRFSNELMVLRDSSLYDGVVGTSDKASGPLGAFLTATKSLSNILPTRSFVTGLTPISLADASSANIYKTVSFEKSVAGTFGFTEADVKDGLSRLTHLEDHQRQTAFDFMTTYFNGYLYYPTEDETSKVDNPQLTLNFLQMLCTAEGPQILRDWQEGNATVAKLVMRVDDPNTRVSKIALELLAKSSLTFADITLLVAKGSIKTSFSLVQQPFTLAQLMRPVTDTYAETQQRDRMLAFMFAHGIVTFDQSRVDKYDTDVVYLKVPNEVVRHQLLRSIQSRL